MKTKLLLFGLIAQAHVQRFIRFALQDKKSILFLAFIGASTSATAQDELAEVKNSLGNKLQSAYDLMSIIVVLAIIYFGAKAVIEAVRGEQGAWQKFGGILIVIAIWFFGFPALINAIKGGSGQNVNGIN